MALVFAAPKIEPQSLSAFASCRQPCEDKAVVAGSPERRTRRRAASARFAMTAPRPSANPLRGIAKRVE
jgi:hypothetical protein